MEIKSSFKTYNLDFIDSLDELKTFSEQKETYFVLDRNIYNLYKEKLPVFPQERLFLMDAIETKKNIDLVIEICEKMTSMSSKRNTHLISIGGGIVQDVTGFVANSLYRGIKWTFYPSTLLAACDSCIGGKSSLNLKSFKNLLGSFFPPDAIRIYPQFFSTLTDRDYCSGLGEVVKFNVIAGEDTLTRIEKDIDKLLSRDYEILMQYVKTSLEFKRGFIEVDEFDRGERILLNFAHTFGHAFETTSNYAIPHGSAVALGMLVANYISYKRGFIEEEYMNRIDNCVRKIITHIEINIEWFSLNNIISAIRKDKKQTSSSINAVLISKDKTLSIYKDIKEEEIQEALDKVFK